MVRATGTPGGTSAPMLPLVIAAASGIVAALFFDLDGRTTGWLLITSVAAMVAILLSVLRRYSFLALIVLIGALFLHMAEREIGRAIRRDVRSLIAESDSCFVVGRIQSVVPDQYGAQLLMEHALLASGADTVHCESHVVRVRAKAWQLAVCKPSNWVMVSGRANDDLREMQTGVNFVTRHLSSKIVCTLFADSLGVSLLADDNVSAARLIDRLQSQLRTNIEHTFQRDAAALVKALWIGEQQDFGPDFREGLRLTGLSHIFALSGMNVGVVAALSWILSGLLRMPRRSRLAFVLVLLVVYCLLGGASPSLVRATLMATLFVVGQWLSRRVEFVNLVCGAMFLELVIAPLDLLTASFLLSYAAVFSIGIFYVRIKRLIPPLRPFVGSGFVRAALEIGVVTMAAQIMIVPLQGLLFHRVPLIGVIANMAAIPGFTALQLLSLPAIIFSALWQPLCRPFVLIVEELSFLLARLVNLFSDLPFAGVDLRSIPALLICFALTSGFVYFVSSKRSRVAKVLVGVLIFNLLVWLPLSARSDNFVVTFVDVENGDATLITHEQIAVLVDAGPRWAEWSAASRIRYALRELQMDELDALILTHPDNDHIGGALELLAAEQVHQVFVNGDVQTSVTHEALCELIQRKSIPVDTLTAGQTLHLGARCNLQVLSPDKEQLSSRERYNQAGLVMRVDCDSSSILLTADVDSSVEHELAVYDSLLEVDLLKVGHHGSKSSSCEGFLQQCRPGLAVISCGMRNRYGHPAPEVLERLKRNAVPTLTTAGEGTMRFRAVAGGWQRELTSGQRLCQLWKLT